MRVYELARALDESSATVLLRLRADGEWIASHLSVVPAPVLRRYLPAKAAPPPPQSVAPIRAATSVASALPSTPSPYALPLRPKRKRRPGPRPITVRGPTRWDDEYGPYDSDLRYEPELTTRDVAELLQVKQATVRQWIARGYIQPSGKEGPSYVFDTYEVLKAHDLISARHKAAGVLPLVDPRTLQRLRQVHPDALLTIAEAARLVAVTPATIRSWLHRGHLGRAVGSQARAVLLRLDDVMGAAQARTLPRGGHRRQ